MKYSSGDREFLRSDGKGFQPISGKNKDLFWILKQLKMKKILKAETLRLSTLKR